MINIHQVGRQHERHKHIGTPNPIAIDMNVEYVAWWILHGKKHNADIVINV
jgi:hypothetical protein